MANETQKKRTRAERAADVLWIERAFLQGCRRVAILRDRLNAERGYVPALSYAQVAFDLRKVKDMFLRTAEKDIEVAREAELRCIDEQEDELWQAWLKSKQDATKKQVTKGGVRGGDGEKISLTKEGQCGDASYMRAIIDLRKQRAEIKGLNAPQRQEISGIGGEPIGVTVLRVTGEELPRARVDPTREVVHDNGDH